MRGLPVRAERFPIYEARVDGEMLGRADRTSQGVGGAACLFRPYAECEIAKHRREFRIRARLRLSSHDDAHGPGMARRGAPSYLSFSIRHDVIAAPRRRLQPSSREC